MSRADGTGGTGAERIRRLRLRWVHLLLGGALLMPYFLLTTVVISIAVPGADPLRHPGWQLAAYGLSLPPAAATALFPLARTLESAAARALCRIPGRNSPPHRPPPGPPGGARRCGSPSTWGWAHHSAAPPWPSRPPRRC
ncbi:hypothetical protein [Streptomyces radiopugnans]|uniref:hypothetical protein n=1 Tax=Streptomyces radiopugnans TaxID=403935 RepID=UPI003F1D26CC